jgi:hypothetical protein
MDKLQDIPTAEWFLIAASVFIMIAVTRLLIWESAMRKRDEKEHKKKNESHSGQGATNP